MKFRNAANSGLILSEIGLGTWLSGASARIQNPDIFTYIVQKAWDRGIRFFDTADVYVKGAAESALSLSLNKMNISEYALATKCFFPFSNEELNKGLSRKHVTESVRMSLSRLNRSSIDIFFCHRFDINTSIREIVLTMKDLIASGLIHHWGTSEWSIENITEALQWAERLGAPHPVADQYELNLLNFSRRRERATQLASLGLGAIAWSPLAGGLLTGKYQDQIPSDSRFGTFNGLRDNLKSADIVRSTHFKDYCSKFNVEPVHVALRLILRDPHITSIIIGATSPSHVDIACDAVNVFIEDQILDGACESVEIYE